MGQSRNASMEIPFHLHMYYSRYMQACEKRFRLCENGIFGCSVTVWWLILLSQIISTQSQNLTVQLFSGLAFTASQYSFHRIHYILGWASPRSLGLKFYLIRVRLYVDGLTSVCVQRHPSAQQQGFVTMSLGKFR